MSELERQTSEWPVSQVATAVVDRSGRTETGGDPLWVRPLASITKILVAYAALVALEEGTIDLGSTIDDDGATIEHLLSHAAGYPFDGATPRYPVGKRRIYSNYGIEEFGRILEERSGMPTTDYVRQAVFEPLGMDATVLSGSPAHGARSCVADLVLFVKELMEPRLIDPSTLEMATSVHFPALKGAVPGFGTFDPNPWGCGFEVKGEKNPHWTAPENSPHTFGHFGGAGTFLWVDPVAGLACVAITDRTFGDWAKPIWPVFSSQVLARFGTS